MFLIYDTESSGLWRDDLAPTDPSQPHLLQLAAELCSDDFRRQALIVGIVKPDGWSIEPQAEEVHHINMIRASRYGVPLRSLLLPFYAMALKAELIVSHHAQFDRAMITTAFHRGLGGVPIEWRKKMNGFFCTMEEATEVCALPGVIPGLPKFPTLEEAHARLVPDVPFASVHDALLDLEACKRVFKALKERATQ